MHQAGSRLALLNLSPHTQEVKQEERNMQRKTSYPGITHTRFLISTRTATFQQNKPDTVNAKERGGKKTKQNNTTTRQEMLNIAWTFFFFTSTGKLQPIKVKCQTTWNILGGGGKETRKIKYFQYPARPSVHTLQVKQIRFKHVKC